MTTIISHTFCGFVFTVEEA